MQSQYVVLREESRNQRTTIADAIDVLETEAHFKDDDGATIWVQPLELPSSVVVWLVSIVFNCPTEATSFVVPLCTATAFSAVQEDKSRKQGLEIELLHGAKADARGDIAA
jgi:hypothetical protein